MALDFHPPRSGPLRDVRVVEVTSSIAGEVSGMLLSELGADVVRVLASETPTPGDPAYAGWLCRNRGKHLTRCDMLENAWLRAAAIFSEMSSCTAKISSRLRS